MILVAGATGALGSEIVRRLIQRGETVRALVRSTSDSGKVDSLAKAGAEIAHGDLKDPDSLRSACRGVKAVISTVSIIATAKPGDSFEATDSEGTRSLIDAAKAQGAERFLFISFDRSGMPDAPIVRAKGEVEDYLKSSGLNYTIIQPSFFMENWLGPMLFADPVLGTAKVYGEGNAKLRYVSANDVAELAVQAVNNPAAKDVTIQFGGPEEISQRDAVRIFEEEFGRSLTVTEIPEAALEAQWSATENPMEKTFSALMLSLARGKNPGGEPPLHEYPMKMTSVREFAKKRRLPASS
ncbi:MAG: SDR family oxidoreductase [Gemmatimonadales bacterium]